MAEVILRMGRWFLVVNGIYVAMETDVCRDDLMIGARWSEGSLRQAAEFINEQRWKTAQERMEIGHEP